MRPLLNKENKRLHKVSQFSSHTIYMFGALTYMHLFALFPLMFYILIINNTNTTIFYNKSVKNITNILVIVVFLSHAFFSNGWLGQPATFFPPIITNMFNAFSNLTISNKCLISVLILISVILFYNLFNQKTKTKN